MTDFAALLRVLAESEVEFIVIGGAAASAHGAARLTADLDIVYRRTPQNIRHLVAALGRHQPYLRGAPRGLPFLWGEETIRKGMNFTLTTTLGEIDLLGEITGGGGYEDLLPHTIRLDPFGIACHCLNLRHLIRVKHAAGRPKDFEVIAELEAILEEQERLDTGPEDDKH